MTSNRALKRLTAYLQTRISLIFALLLVGITVLINGYWFFILEPQLHSKAVDRTGTIAQVQAHLFAKMPASATAQQLHDEFQRIVNDILLLQDSNTGTPFIRRVEVEIDYDVMRLEPGSLDLSGGDAACPLCFIDEVPLYSADSKELYGIARFYSDSGFFQSMKEEVRQQLFMASVGLLLLLIFVWWITALMIKPLRSLSDCLQRYTEGDNLGHLPPLQGIVGEEIHMIKRALDARFDKIEEYTHALRDSEALNRSVIEHAPLGIATVTPEGFPILTNAALHRILGYSAEELASMPFTQFTHPDDVERDWNQYQALLNREIDSYQMEKRYIHKSGSVVWGNLTVSLIFDKAHKPKFSVAMLEDVGLRKQMEENLQLANQELEKRVTERTADLQALNMELQKSLDELRKAKRQLVESEKMASLGMLVAGVAHEINTPVGVGVTTASYLQDMIHLYTEKYQQDQLTRQDFEDFLKKADEAGAMILTNLQRAAALVSGFKQIAVDRGDEECRLFNLNAYLHDTLHSLSPHFKNKPHQITVDCPSSLAIYSHPGTYSQIFANLVMNSLIHAFPKGATGYMQFHVEKQEKQLVLKYQDDGCGINSEDLAKIFEPFFTTRRGAGGTGLGLHIVYNLVTQKLGGTIQCDSKPGQGTLFTIQLPLTQKENFVTVGQCL